MPSSDTQFKPGQSGNPGGRPKRGWTWQELYEEAVEEENKSGIPFKKVIAQKIRTLAVMGDMAAIKELTSRMDGMAKQETDITTGGKPLVSLDTKPEM